MMVKELELDDLSCATGQLDRENRQSDRARGSDRERVARTHSGLGITFRVKRDRRSVVTHVDPAHERRRR